MSSDQGFKRCDGFVGSVPQNFINANLPVCPLCGSPDPYWLLKDKMELTAHRILFRCSRCGGIISATQGDFSGTTKSTAYTVLTTAGAVDALVKKSQGKDIKTVYMKVEDVGDFRIGSDLLGKELPIDEFKAMAASFSNQYQQAPQADATIAPQFSVSYGAAPQQSPQYAPAPAPEFQQAPQYAPAPAPEFQQAPQYAPAPEFQQAPQYAPAPAPEFQQAPQYAPAPAPEFQQAPQYAPAPAPEFQQAPQYAPAPAPEFQQAPQYAPAPAPEFQQAPQYAPAPEFQQAPQYAPAPAPEFQQAPQYAPAPVPEFQQAPQYAPAPGYQQVPQYAPVPQPANNGSDNFFVKLFKDKKTFIPAVLCAAALFLSFIWFFVDTVRYIQYVNYGYYSVFNLFFGLFRDTIELAGIAAIGAGMILKKKWSILTGIGSLALGFNEFIAIFNLFSYFRFASFILLVFRLSLAAAFVFIGLSYIIKNSFFTNKLVKMIATIAIAGINTLIFLFFSFTIGAIFGWLAIACLVAASIFFYDRMNEVK